MNILEVYIKNIYVWMANTTQYGRGLVPQNISSSNSESEFCD